METIYILGFIALVSGVAFNNYRMKQLDGVKAALVEREILKKQIESFEQQVLSLKNALESQTELYEEQTESQEDEVRELNERVGELERENDELARALDYLESERSKEFYIVSEELEQYTWAYRKSRKDRQQNLKEIILLHTKLENAGINED
jgi:hypothetical protein